MKIDPASPPALPPPPGAPDAAPPTPFDAVLAALAAARDRSGPAPTFAFRELSLFGLGGAVACPAAAPPPDAEAEGTPAVAPTRSPIAPDPRPAAVPAEPQPAAPGARRLEAPTGAPTARAGPPRAAPRTAQGAASPSDPPAEGRAAGRTDSPEESGAGEPERAGRLRQRLARLRSGVSLILTEKDGRVELVAGSPQIDPEARAALRRLARDLLARNGLSLAHFQLNGAPLAPDSLDLSGGFDGTRAR